MANTIPSHAPSWLAEAKPVGTQLVEIPGVGVVEFPADVSDAEIEAVARREYQKVTGKAGDPWATPPTVAELGQRVKAKYPGSYDDMADADVGRAVKAKHPGAYDDFRDAPASGRDPWAGTMIIELPDGRELEAPAGLSPSQIKTIVQKHMGGGAQAPTQAGPLPSSGSEWSQKAGEGALPGFNRVTAALGATVSPILPRRNPYTGKWGIYAPGGDTWGGRYRAELEALQGQSAETQREHPWASAAAQTAGGAMSAAALPGAKVAEGTSVLPRVLALAKQGAGAGAAYGAGDAPAGADLSTIAAHTAGGAAGGALLGAGAGALMPSHEVSPLAASLLPREPSRLGSMAESAAVRSTNADRTAYRRAFGKPANEEKLHATGRFLLDESVPLRSPKAMQEGLGDVLSQEGPAIGNMAKTAGKNGATFDLEAAAVNALDSPQIAKLRGDTEGRPTYERIVNFLQDQLERNGNALTPEAGHKLRMRLDDLAKWDKTRPDDVNAAWRAARDAVNEELGATMERAGLGDEWRQSNATFSKAMTAKGLADVGAERRAGNRLGSPSEKLAAIGGGIAAVTHEPLAALALPATVGLNRLGMPVAARSLDALSKAGARAGAAAMRLDPRAAAVTAALQGNAEDEASPAAQLVAAMRARRAAAQP